MKTVLISPFFHLSVTSRTGKLLLSTEKYLIIYLKYLIASVFSDHLLNVENCFMENEFSSKHSTH